MASCWRRAPPTSSSSASRGSPPWPRAAQERLSPILMTALTAALGLLPLALALGKPGSEIQAPMALVILDRSRRPRRCSTWRSFRRFWRGSVARRAAPRHSPRASGKPGPARVFVPWFAPMAALREIDGPRPTAVILGVQLQNVSDETFEGSLKELARLGETLGLNVIGRVTQRRTQLLIGSVVGAGKLRELATHTGGTGVIPSYRPPGKEKEEEPAEPEPPSTNDEEDGASSQPAAVKATIVLVDHDLTPAPDPQPREGDRRRGARSLDGDPVDLPAPRAHPRGAHAGGDRAARVPGAAPARGATRARIGSAAASAARAPARPRSSSTGARIRDRIAELQARARGREARGRHAPQRGARPETNTVALVGYTNAGKSSLMRALTGDEVYVADQLFATLDTTVRVLKPETQAAHPRLRHRRLHQEAAARPGRVVSLHARRGRRRGATFARGGRLGSGVSRPARGHAHGARGDRRGRQPYPADPEQGGQAGRRSARLVGDGVSGRGDARRLATRTMCAPCTRASRSASTTRWRRPRSSFPTASNATWRFCTNGPACWRSGTTKMGQSFAFEHPLQCSRLCAVSWTE